MTESDYVLIADLTKLRMAHMILHDCGDPELASLRGRLGAMIQRYSDRLNPVMEPEEEDPV